MPGNNNSQIQPTLSLASRNSIEIAFQRLCHNFSNDQWLQNNIYSQNTIRNINGNLDNIQISDYIAASIPNHCLDGWSFLSKAIHSALHGDYNIARHLAYYAELRAAMSLLASGGIGVFDKTHIVIDNIQVAHKISDISTHFFTWKALTEWAATQDAASVFGSIIQIERIPLYDWISGFKGIANLPALAAYWCSSWGIDLQQFSNDRNSRNTVSYRPSNIANLTDINVKDNTSYIIDFWNIFNPEEITCFNRIDKYLLRKSLKKINQQFPLPKGSSKHFTFRDRTEIMTKSIYSNQMTINNWVTFFDGTGYPEPSLLIEAEKRHNFYHATHHLEVISRAALLLRIATGSCSQLIKKAMYTSSDLMFWWNYVGSNRGIWNKQSQPSHDAMGMLSLWNDIEHSMINLENWESVTKNPSLASLSSSKAKDVNILESCERIGLWGLIP